jgi:hypothetical protein
MARSRREAKNGLILGYKKAEEVARKKVATEVSVFPAAASLQTGSSTGLAAGSFN